MNGLTQPSHSPGFRSVPRTGVIYVMHRASQAGYGSDQQEWFNLGQGSPEVGVLPGAPPRVEGLEVDPTTHSYGPVGGLVDLREQVAELYNHLFRRGKSSQYTAENVSIAPGGRAAMTRVAAALGPMNLGHFIPDYTAYEELLFTFRGFIPIPILLSPKSGYVIDAEQLEDEIVGRGLSAVLSSNPSNPTGRLVAGLELGRWVDVARRCRCAMIFDEFYSHFIYDGVGSANHEGIVSAAEFVDDVDLDPVVIVDGLTKNWRYPGWRVSWIVGPRAVIEQATSAGSFLDGGANHPFQRAALDLLRPAFALQEARAIRDVFQDKRQQLRTRLEDLGVRFDAVPGGTFYLWGDLSELPPTLADGNQFFELALAKRVITVPGVFFDVNPGRRRSTARYQTYSRFSFGPELSVLERGLDRIERLIEEHR